MSETFNVVQIDDALKLGDLVKGEMFKFVDSNNIYMITETNSKNIQIANLANGTVTDGALYAGKVSRVPRAVISRRDS